VAADPALWKSLIGDSSTDMKYISCKRGGRFVADVSVLPWYADKQFSPTVRTGLVDTIHTPMIITAVTLRGHCDRNNHTRKNLDGNLVYYLDLDDPYASRTRHHQHHPPPDAKTKQCFFGRMLQSGRGQESMVGSVFGCFLPHPTACILATGRKLVPEFTMMVKVTFCTATIKQ
jgi:hypothetical protein